MIIIILVLVAFLILVYVYHYIKWKKRKDYTADTVKAFHQNYVDRIHGSGNKESINHTARNNNRIDYMEKEQYMSAVNDLTEESLKKNDTTIR